MEENETARVNLIACAKWVKKGVAKANPEKVQLSKVELIQVIKDTQEKLKITDENTEAGTSGQDEFNLANYDEDETTAQTLGIDSLAEFQDNLEDHFSESDDSDREDELIKPTDNLILVGHVENDASVLEVYVYNEVEESLYVHHDLILPAFPLCVEWLDYEPNAPKGSYCAVGTMGTFVQIWDLDIINCIEPAYTLGSSANYKKNRSHVGHTDAVLSLAWNQSFDHILASGSVDKTVILWDLETQKPSTTLTAFKEKVQCLKWHGLEAQTLLAGGCDKMARVFDCRSPDVHQKWKLGGEAESLAWNPLQPFTFFVGTDIGTLAMFDCRKGKLWSVEAHEKEVTGLVVSGQCPGLLVTNSSDGTLKTWDYSESTASCVFETDFKIGSMQCLDLCPDSPFVIAAGGDNKESNFKVYDLRNFDVVKHQFESRQLVELVSEPSNEGSNMNTDD